MHIGRTRLLALATIAAVLIPTSSIPTANAGTEQGTVSLTWFGFTTFEIAAPDYSSVVYTNPNIWLYKQAEAFGVELQPQYQSPEALAAFLKEKNARDVVLTLTNDHPDEIGDIFEIAQAFEKAGLDYRIVAQSDLARSLIEPELMRREMSKDAVLKIGYGGKVTVGDVRIIGTLALHGSSPWPVSMVIEVDGVRIWHTGGTAIFSDMNLIRKLYEPQIALISMSDAQFSMGPREAAYATRLLRPEIAIPTHYLASETFPGVSTVEDLDDFEQYVKEFSFGKVDVVVLTLGEPFTYTAKEKTSVKTSASESTVTAGSGDQTVYLAGTGAIVFVAGVAAGMFLGRKGQQPPAA